MDGRTGRKGPTGGGETESNAVTSSGGRLVAADGRTLPLRGVRLRAEAGGGLARVALEQRFVNPYAEPLRVTYLVPLPLEGALAGYAIRVGERRIVGEVDRITTARERFEEAIVEGRAGARPRPGRALGRGRARHGAEPAHRASGRGTSPCRRGLRPADHRSARVVVRPTRPDA